MRATVECFEQTCADRPVCRVRKIGKAGVATFEVHHEAVAEVHAKAFRRHVGPVLKVREGYTRYFGQAADLLKEREPARGRHIGAKPTEHDMPHGAG